MAKVWAEDSERETNVSLPFVLESCSWLIMFVMSPSFHCRPLLFLNCASKCFKVKLIHPTLTRTVLKPQARGRAVLLQVLCSNLHGQEICEFFLIALASSKIMFALCETAFISSCPASRPDICCTHRYKKRLTI